MGFHNVSIDDHFDYGFRSGPGFQTIIQTSASGHETRIQRWAEAKWRMQASKSPTVSEAADLFAFFLGRRGSFYSFRVKDWTDYTSESTGRTAASITSADQLIGTGDGTTQTFQLRKQYDLTGPSPYVRTIKLPVASTVVVALDGTPKSEGVDYTVNTQTGIVTMASAPANGVVVTAGFQFDVEARGDEELDKWLSLGLEAFSRYSLPIGLVGVLDESQSPETWDAGGSTSGKLSFGAAISLDAHTKFWHLDPTASHVQVFMPAPVYLSGGHYFDIYVDSGSTGSIDLLDDTGTAIGTLSGVAATDMVRLWLVHDTVNDTHQWIGALV